MAFSFRLQRFCCCCTLRTGSLVIATLGWTFTLVSLFGLTSPRAAKHESASTEMDKRVEEILESVESNSLGARIGYTVISLIVCILLICGIYKKDARFMLPYLIVQCIECVLISIIAVIVFVCIFLVPADLTVIAVLVFFLFLISTFLYWYFWLCVWSHYKELEEGEQQPTVYYSPTCAASLPTEKDRQQMI